MVKTLQNPLIQQRQTVIAVCPKKSSAGADSLPILIITVAKIRKFRNALMLSQAEFAAWLGVKQSYVARMESGERNVIAFTYECNDQNNYQLLRLCIFGRLFVESDLSQLAFAEKLGLTQRDVSHYVTKKKPISESNWARVMAVYPDPIPTDEDRKSATDLFEQRMS